MNGYFGFYKNKRFECFANSSYHAQQQMAKEHGIKKSFEITVVLAEKDGKQTVHNPQDILT